jgi:hypothetical protein
VLGVTGGLVLAGASLAAWVQQVTVSDVAGVPIETVAVTLGVELAPLALPLGVAAAALGFALALRAPRVRRVVGAALLVLGVFALLVVGRGIVAGLALQAGIGTGAVVAALGAVAVASAGAVAIRPGAAPPPSLPARYDIDAEDDDREWHLASADDEDAEGVGGG